MNSCERFQREFSTYYADRDSQVLCHRYDWLGKFGLRDYLCRDPKLASHCNGNGFTENREARRPSPTDLLSQTLQRS